MMASATVGICSAFYESGRDYLTACVESIQKSARRARAEATLLVVLDDLEDPDGTLRPFRDNVAIHAVQASPNATVADVQRAMFDAAARLDVQFLVFVDMDDVLLPGAINLHLEALSEADLSYGDLLLMDAAGHSLPGTLYEAAEIPEAVRSVEPLRTRNFMGMSNTAMRQAVPLHHPLAIPSHLAATDWWVFTSLIDAGYTARRTSGPVACYRQHKDNVLGADPAIDLGQLRRRCGIMREHYEALCRIDGYPALAARMRKLEDAIEADPVHVIGLMDRNAIRPAAWFEEVFRVSERFERGEEPRPC